MSKLTDTIAAMALPVIEKNGCELWDIEYVKEAGTWYLRLYIDCKGGVDINQCEAISRELDPMLDELDPIPGNYTFEVSSAGAERSLKRPEDFERFLGSLVEVKLYKAKDGRKEYLGNLVSYDNGSVAIDIAGTSITFSGAEIANVRLRISF